jgi:hypothetical protein
VAAQEAREDEEFFRRLFQGVRYQGQRRYGGLFSFFLTKDRKPSSLLLFWGTIEAAKEGGDGLNPPLLMAVYCSADLVII